MITVKPTGESYIGSSVNIQRRKQSHWSNLRRCYRDGYVCASLCVNGGGIYAAAVCHDPDIVFEFSVLEELEPSSSLLTKREQYWVDFFNPSLNIRRTVYRHDQSRH